MKRFVVVAALLAGSIAMPVQPAHAGSHTGLIKFLSGPGCSVTFSASGTTVISYSASMLCSNPMPWLELDFIVGNVMVKRVTAARTDHIEASGSVAMAPSNSADITQAWVNAMAERPSTSVFGYEAVTTEPECFPVYSTGANVDAHPYQNFGSAGCQLREVLRTGVWPA